MSKDQASTQEIINYAPVIPDIHDWPIYKMAANREALIAAVIARTEENLLAEFSAGKGILRNIADVYYQERARLQTMPWKVDPKDEQAFWSRIRSRLQKMANNDEKTQVSEAKEILHEIVERYTREIAGDFRIGTFNFARRATNFGFSRVFNAAQEGLFKSLRKQRRDLQEKMRLVGETEKIRELTKKGTVLLVPTHFSNLDSIVIGWAIEALGLPAYTYGAGINLFGHPLLSYFMSRLGAFRVDRRKKNSAYLNVLKTYSEEVLYRGGHMLFFPGGTRSRSGGLEKRVKLGLLGTAIETQKRHLDESPENPHKIFVVPLVISYHSVLEARGLIDEFLRQEGRERFVLLGDDFSSLRKNIRFVWKFLQSSSEMVFSFGEPMDLFGNKLDKEGQSIDKYGQVLNLNDYFKAGGVQTDDPQRNQEYTRLLGQKILDCFKVENVVFSSHLVAFADWHMLLKEKVGDLYGLLNIAEEDIRIDESELIKTIDRLHVRMRELERANLMKMAPHLHSDMKSILEHGLKNLGVYHIDVPLLRRKPGIIGTQDSRQLLFYANRLDGYELEKYV